MIKDFVSKILNWYFDKSPLLSDVHISYAELLFLLSKQFQCNSVVCSDNSYRTISRSGLNRALKLNFIKFIKYRAENFDCDDYSFVFCGQMKLLLPNIACGIVQSKTHAFNFVVLDDKSVVVIEPQTNRLYSYAEYSSWPTYCPAKLVML